MVFYTGHMMTVLRGVKYKIEKWMDETFTGDIEMFLRWKK